MELLQVLSLALSLSLTDTTPLDPYQKIHDPTAIQQHIKLKHTWYFTTNEPAPRLPGKR
jgi:hypothetical protein